MPRPGHRFHALANRDVIGLAKGILVERHRITADADFGCLSRASQEVNMKLTGVARHSSKPVNCSARRAPTVSPRQTAACSGGCKPPGPG